MFKRICKITFICHGATVYTNEGIVSTSLKHAKLNDIGEDEIKKVCNYLKMRGIAYDKIYSSQNSACTKSAQIVAKLFKQKSEVIDLEPRNYGSWNGMYYSDIFKEFGSNALSLTPEEGEAIKDFNDKVANRIDKLIEGNKGNRIILVTTSDVIQSAIARTLELNVTHQHNMLIQTGSITQISYFKDWSSIIYSNYLPQ